MYKINSIKVNYYYSSIVKLEYLISHLIGLKVSNNQDLLLRLEDNRKLVQIGSIIKPPIRWLDSLEKHALFEFVCKTSNESELQYMPGELSRISTVKNEHGLFLYINTNDFECIS